MRSRVSVIVIALALAVLLIATGQLGISMMITGQTVAVVMGGAVTVLALLGFWALYAEIRFGLQSAKLVQQLLEDEDLAVSALPRTESGRFDRTAACNLLAIWQQKVSDQSEDWQDLLQLSLLYDAVGQRTKAREIARRAIRCRLA